ncbi:MAG TPA: MFS transporter, partial [Methylococcales bacterium]
MYKYAMGDGAVTIALNSMAAFSMIYYTDALGLKSSLAGLAMSLSLLYDAIIDPVMGHITDNTRSRYGRRLPYMLLGGIAMMLSYYFIWKVPGAFKGSTMGLFGYLLAMNMIFRTAFAVFVIPYSALGFEICTDYHGRTRLQGIKAFMQMAPNLLSAFAWTIFFVDRGDVRAVTVESNYLSMARTFTIVGFAFMVAVLLFTRKYIEDSRTMPLRGNSVRAFAYDMKEIILDKYSKWVFLFLFIVMLGPTLMGTIQIYLYEHFMRFTPVQKTIAHGGGMVGSMLGSLLVVPYFARRFDKRKGTCIACGLAVASNVILAILFLPGILKPGQSLPLMGISIPYAFIVFVFFHICFWLGINGVMFPIASSMMPDISEIYELRTGTNKDGSYAAVATFICKFAYGI